MDALLNGIEEVFIFAKLGKYTSRSGITLQAVPQNGSSPQKIQVQLTDRLHPPSPLPIQRRAFAWHVFPPSPPSLLPPASPLINLLYPSLESYPLSLSLSLCPFRFYLSSSRISTINYRDPICLILARGSGRWMWNTMR
jgi:hypothetical protein